MNRSLLAAIILFAPCMVRADPADFSVTIVGTAQGQEHRANDDHADKDKGFPVIVVPNQVDTDRHAETHLPTGSPFTPFYVVVRNISKKPIRLDLWSSSWYGGLIRFVVTGANGKVFSIHQPYRSAVFGNVIESWVFQPDGLRVFPIDFASERWDGLPSLFSDLPQRQPFKIKATFMFFDRKNKAHVFDSDTIEAYLPY